MGLFAGAEGNIFLKEVQTNAGSCVKGRVRVAGLCLAAGNGDWRMPAGWACLSRFRSGY